MPSTEHKDEPFEEGKENSHSQTDPKDQRSLANRVAAEKQANEDEDSPEVARMKEDPTAPAREHGNEPSRGAKIDAKILQEEQAELERKGKA
ncbi:hypothetical protein CCM_01055 [Cordyceps militaris CM01]|uniref:Uncharacterized protein n=2 Tax=Cordyceps militaris TaxID=73501 RepID=G3J2R5_CORMM|nr:uncharacterized protein CCM_01055 [Cordyceps militaris CM01]ATY61967.1 hypothetical protein A9K55_008422 [Cordyceps militaris]EGX96399.1 hypothetical protein CCM_01055 [Cordyceps militaris CM01]